MNEAVIHDAPIAVASDGSILINAAHLVQDETGLAEVVEQAVEFGEPVFIGVAVPVNKMKDARAWITNGAWELVGNVGGAMLTRRRRRLRAGHKLKR